MKPGMGLSYKAMGDFEKAIKCYDKAIKIKPDFYRAWFNKVLLLDDIGKTEESIDVWEKTIGISETEDAWYGLGCCLYKTKRYNESLHAFEQAIKIDPNSARAWTNKGATLVCMNKFNEAVQCFKEALRIDPDFGPAKRNLEHISQPLLRKNTSKNLSSGIIPLDILEYYSEANKNIEENNYDAAIDAILKTENMLTAIKPVIEKHNELQSLATSATLFRKLRKRDEAIIRLKQACQLAEEIDPDSWATVGDYCNLGQCYKTIGKTIDAVSAFTRALALAKKIDPTNPYVRSIKNIINQLIDISKLKDKQ